MWGFSKAGKPRKNAAGQLYWELPGSVHPPENKSRSLTGPIQPMPLVREYVVPLNQHIGAFALPCVEVGQKVLKGEMIAEAAGFISAPAHAPTSGEIVSIEERQVPHASGLSTTCIVIRSDGKDTWRPRQPWDDLTAHRTADILARVQRSGLTGLGGASFPTAVKLASDRDHIDTLIVNGTECEPYITADHSLMLERSAAIYAGIAVVDHLYHFNRILVAIEDNKPDAIAVMQQAIPAELQDRIEVRTFPTRYPSGGEKQLIYILTGREVPSGGLPFDLGMLCHNVGTLAALSDAVYHDEPLLHRVTTVTGDAVARPGNYDTLIGTPMRELCRVAGVNTETADRAIMGGPMMGFTLPHLDLPVVKATNCLLIPTATELPLPGIAQPCIRCGLCEQACPASLLPQQLMWFAQSKELDKAEEHRLFDCIECGACAYVCPSNIPLVQHYRAAKGQIRQEQAEQKQAERARVRFEARQARLDREAAEKEAKRQERAAAAARVNAAKLVAESTDSTDVADAVARTNSKHPDKPAAALPPVLTEEQLSAKLSNLTGRIAKAEAKLTEARANAPEQVKALETTVKKLQEQVKKVETDLAQTRAQEQN